MAEFQLVLFKDGEKVLDKTSDNVDELPSALTSFVNEQSDSEDTGEGEPQEEQPEEGAQPEPTEEEPQSEDTEEEGE